MVVIRVRLLFIHDFRGGKEEGIGVNCERWKRWKHPFQWRFLCLLWCLSCRWPCLDWLGGDVAGGSTFLSQIFEVQTQFPHAQMQLERITKSKELLFVHQFSVNIARQIQSCITTTTIKQTTHPIASYSNSRSIKQLINQAIITNQSGNKSDNPSIRQSIK